MKTPEIAVFCGGVSPEREISLVSGKNVAEALSENFETRLLRLDENALPAGLDPRKTIVFPAMHGEYGEDGALQAQLEAAGFAYAGCGPLSSRVCMSKPASKALMEAAGVPVPRSVNFRFPDIPSAGALRGVLGGDGIILKPADKGSSVGLYAARGEEELAQALSEISEGSWLAEEMLRGRELSVGVIFGKATGIVEIIPDGGVYDFKRKYTPGSTRYEFPAKISDDASSAVARAAERAFEACGCRDFARVDFILSDEAGPAFAALEINTLPGMTPTSLLPKSAACAGYDFASLCAKLAEGAIARHAEMYGGPNG